MVAKLAKLRETRRVPGASLFLDIDGTLLVPGDGPTRKGWGRQTLSAGTVEFFRLAAMYFNCHWLSAWAKVGRRSAIDSGLMPHLPPQAKKFKVAYWRLDPYEAFERVRDTRWLWFDDEDPRDDGGYSAWMAEAGVSVLRVGKNGEWSREALKAAGDRVYVWFASPGPRNMEAAAEIIGAWRTAGMLEFRDYKITHRGGRRGGQ